MLHIPVDFYFIVITVKLEIKQIVVNYILKKKEKRIIYIFIMLPHYSANKIAALYL